MATLRLTHWRHRDRFLPGRSLRGGNASSWSIRKHPGHCFLSVSLTWGALLLCNGETLVYVARGLAGTWLQCAH